MALADGSGMMSERKIGVLWLCHGSCRIPDDTISRITSSSIGFALTCYPLVARYYIINLVLLVQSSSVMGCDRLVKVAISSAVCGASLNQHGLLLISHFL